MSSFPVYIWKTYGTVITKSQRNSGAEPRLSGVLFANLLLLMLNRGPNFFFFHLSSHHSSFRIYQLIDLIFLINSVALCTFLSCGAWRYMVRDVLLTLWASERELCNQEVSIPVLLTSEYLIPSIFNLSPHSWDP